MQTYSSSKTLFKKNKIIELTLLYSKTYPRIAVIKTMYLLSKERHASQQNRRESRNYPTNIYAQLYLKHRSLSNLTEKG